MMPSEDEDFDAVIRPVKARKPRTPRQAAPQVISNQPPALPEAPAPEPVAVAVAEPEEPAYEMLTESPEEAAYAPEESLIDPEPTAEPEPQHSAPKFVEPFVAPMDMEAPKAPRAPRPKRNVNGRLIIEALLVLALLGLGYWSWTLYSDRSNLRHQVTTLSANPQLAVQKQTDDLIAAVGRLVTLPAGETPTIANVSDATQARQQSAFFKDAQNGDRVLMYVKAGEAILYRPATNKIILLAPLTFNADAAAKQP
jgi:hypothetical protein